MALSPQTQARTALRAVLAFGVPAGRAAATAPTGPRPRTAAR
ncbi:hypothetical protein [Streptomyces sp. NPDC093600]